MIQEIEQGGLNGHPLHQVYRSPPCYQKGTPAMLAEVAQQWRQAGVSIIPILDNGTKRSAVRWAEYQVRIPNLGEIDQWWRNGRQYGIAIICGQVSGNLEMTEIEGRASSGDSLLAIKQAMDKVGATAIWDDLREHGYMEMSPSGGLHFLYRISDNPVPGNEKIATGADGLVLAETRGEGGYVIVAPTSGLCHPSGDSWTLLRGEVGSVPTLAWEARCLLHAGLKLALDVAPVSTALNIQETVSPSLPRLPGPVVRPDGDTVSPNDDFEAHTSWSEILEPHGWRLESERHGEQFWTRPDKDPRLGASATTGYRDDRDRLYVFSTNTVFQAEVSYTKYMAWAILNFNGDKRAATSELVRRGFGARAELAELEELPWPTSNRPREYNDTGNAGLLLDRVKDRFLYLSEEKVYYTWDGRCWIPDLRGALVREYQGMCRDMRKVAVTAGESAEVKRWTAAGNNGKVIAALNLLRSEPGITVLSGEMNQGLYLLNVANGILNLDHDFRLLPHEPNKRQTRMFGAAFDPNATCPRFDAFVEAALPDPEMQHYVRRALGYSLRGDVDQRAMFLIYGPSGTGKSTLMETMRYVFGGYGTTAASGTFRSRGRDASGPSNDLHGLRNKRFVTTSETAESAAFDEDLLKRLTGRDSVTSRELYQGNVEWVPECVIWMATNHPPRFNSDDDAIWRRAKLVPFTTQFTGEGEVFDMARRYLAPEASGILNWLLTGLRWYLAEGLCEPAMVVQAARDLRTESDSVLRFLDDQIGDGMLVVGPDYEISAKELFGQYQGWCAGFGERPLRTRRFNHRLESGPYAIRRHETAPLYLGVGRRPGAGIMGTYVPTRMIFGHND